MKKKNNNEVSHEEKIEFYHKYNDEKFLAELRATEDKYWKIGFNFLKIFLVLSFVGGIFSLWMFFLMIPAMVVPVSMMVASYKINKKRIDNLTPNMTYEKFIEMFDNGEWQQIVRELNDEFIVEQDDITIDEAHPSIIDELKKHDYLYLDEDKAFHDDNHDNFSL